MSRANPQLSDRPLRIVAYTNNRNSLLADSVARCINGRSGHMCRCIWGNASGSGILFDGYREWTRAPSAVREELASADLIIRCASEIAPQHRSLANSKAIVALTPYRPNADTSVLRIRVSRCLGGEAQTQDAGKHEGLVPFPLPWWEEDYSPASREQVLNVCSNSEPLGCAGEQEDSDLRDKGRRSHIFIDDCTPGGGGGYSMAALAWGCVVINGFSASASSRATLRSLTGARTDPPFLCASPETLDALLACLMQSGPETLAIRGRLNRRWIEEEWDFSRQWSLCWTPVVNTALGVRSASASLDLRHEPASCSQRSKSVSVVVVSRNEGAYLRRTIHSLHQSLSSRDEIIVVDDQSTDGSAESLPETYAGVRVLTPEERLGVAGARNYGAQHASGDLLVFSDAHIEVPKDWAAPMIDALAAPDAGAAGAGLYSLEYRNGKGVCGGRWCPGSRDDLRWQWLGCRDSEPYPVPLLSGGFLAMRHDVFDAVKGFDFGMWKYGVEDSELSVRLWTLGYQCLAVPRVLVAHRFSWPARNAACEYKSNLEIRIHNKLRLAVLHFGPKRIERALKGFASMRAFPAAYARLSVGDAWVRRREIQSVRAHDDDWYFQRFESSL